MARKLTLLQQNKVLTSVGNEDVELLALAQKRRSALSHGLQRIQFQFQNVDYAVASAAAGLELFFLRRLPLHGRVP
jgi:hypothetical protein